MPSYVFFIKYRHPEPTGYSPIGRRSGFLNNMREFSTDSICALSANHEWKTVISPPKFNDFEFTSVLL